MIKCEGVRPICAAPATHVITFGGVVARLFCDIHARKTIEEGPKGQHMRLLKTEGITLWSTVIEWDEANEPTCIVALTDELAEAAAVEPLAKFLTQWDKGGEFLKDFPPPDIHDALAVTVWLTALREYTCTPWVTTKEVPLLRSLT